MADENGEDLDDADAVDLSNDMLQTLDDDSGVGDDSEDSAESDDSEADSAETDDSDADSGKTDDSDADSGKTDDSDTTHVQSDDSGEEKGKHAKGSARERIEELSRLRREAEKAAFEAEMRLIEFQRNSSTAAQSKPVPDEPKAKDFTYGEVDPEYIDAVVNYRVTAREQEIRASAEAENQTTLAAREAERYSRRLQEVMQAGKKRFKDFDAAVNGVNFTPEIARMILDSDRAIDIAYHLSNNIGDLREMTKASSSDRARMLGRLEGRYSAASAAKKKTKAPEVMGSRAGKAAPKSEAAYGPDDQDAFDKAFFGRS